MRNGFVCAVLVILTTISIAAQRVVLFEDFTNSGCGPCWNVENQINAFVNTNLPSGNLCVIRTHVNWPAANDPIYLANPTEQAVRKAQYGVSSVPYFKMDGILNVSAGNLQTPFNQRVAIPAIIAIDVARNGDDTSGTFSFRIIAEEDPGWTVPMNIWPIIVEDNIPGVGYWSSSVFEQAFRDNVLGYYGEELVFEGPYPDTIFTEAEYTIASTWDVNELHLATFVQCSYQANEHEVENCHWVKLLDIEMGIDDADWNGSNNLFLSVGPNPSNGSFNISAVLPGNSTGTVEVFNLAGRTVASGSATEMQNVSVDEAGIYLVRLSTSDGMSVTESVAVLR
ncbi:MAG: T9SS type A sorting domain-containing protein [Candidatus Sabulitectum sp.]|nr:T9SS type A sorting domain-containing protein [Candidatus Sabulitectum sp.]